MIYLALRSVFRHVRRTPELYVPIALVLLLCGLVALRTRHARRQSAVVQTVTPTTQTTAVDTVSLTAKDVQTALGDPRDKAQIAALLAQVARLKAEVKAVVVSTAELTTGGSGKLVTTTTNVLSTRPEPATTIIDAPPAGPTEFTFHDWQLSFTGNMTTGDASYTLDQRFQTLVTVGRKPDGTQFALAQLYQLTEDGPVLVPTLQTNGIFADQTSPRWMRQLGIMGGVAATRDANGRTANGAVVALQWLTRGRTRAAEDTTFALLSPALVLAKDATDIGLLPVSVNLGRIPHQPLTNVWVSPYISKSQRIGILVTAKF